MTPGSGYLQSLSKENVQVVTQSVVKFTKNGVVDDSGVEHLVDVVVCATGFDVSFTPHFEVKGRNGVDLKEEFGELPKAYLSITAPQFPNLFRKRFIPIQLISYNECELNPPKYSSVPTDQRATARFSQS